jgi:hypothetical protein
VKLTSKARTFSGRSAASQTMEQVNIVDSGSDLTNEIENETKFLLLLAGPRRIEYENSSAPLGSEKETDCD